MAFANNMSKLVELISTRLGIEMMMDKLPSHINKYQWVKLIQNDVIDLYSRYYPHMVKYTCIPSRDYNHKTGVYNIDEQFIKSSGVIIKGVKGIDKEYQMKHGNIPAGMVYNPNFSSYYNSESSIIDTMSTMTYNSQFQNNYFLEFLPPNGFKITNFYYSDVIKHSSKFELELLVNHSKSLITIPPNAMSTFEDLCTSKIAELLYGNLKYFDGIETGYQAIDLKLDTIQDWSNKVDDIIKNIQDGYISATNKNMPLMYLI